jgi:hypothetical protein
MSPHDATDTPQTAAPAASRQLGLALFVLATAQLMLAQRRGAPPRYASSPPAWAVSLIAP